VVSPDGQVRARASVRGRMRYLTAAITTLCVLALVPVARGATATLNTTVTMSDGVALAATVTGTAPLTSRPTIVEFSPYGPGTGTAPVVSGFNYLLIQDRGTGDSPGQWDALGPQTQQDVQQTLRWACHQPWSDGRLALNGFSASAITVYNSLHLKLPCVRAAVLKSGTYSLYRDLLYPGGVNNFVPGLGVLSIIGGETLAQGPERLSANPLTGLIDGFDTGVGYADVGLSDLGHPTLDSFWAQRQYQGDANHFPILMVDSFYDVESQGAFAAYRALRKVGDRLLVVAGHDGYPAGTDGGVADIDAWLERYLLGVHNGILRQPKVQMLMSDGSRETYDDGQYVRYDASNWPVPGTSWMTL
jgi:predicted acyl esterase